MSALLLGAAGLSRAACPPGGGANPRLATMAFGNFVLRWIGDPVRANVFPLSAWRASSRLSVASMVTLTLAVPWRWNPSSCAARRDTSMTLPFAKGPRSLTVRRNDRPFSKLVTCTKDGMGKVLCAAVNEFWS